MKRPQTVKLFQQRANMLLLRAEQNAARLKITRVLSYELPNSEAASGVKLSEQFQNAGMSGNGKGVAVGGANDLGLSGR